MSDEETSEQVSVRILYLKSSVVIKIAYHCHQQTQAQNNMNTTTEQHSRILNHVRLIHSTLFFENIELREMLLTCWWGELSGKQAVDNQ